MIIIIVFLLNLNNLAEKRTVNIVLEMYPLSMEIEWISEKSYSIYELTKYHLVPIL